MAFSGMSKFEPEVYLMSVLVWAGTIFVVQGQRVKVKFPPDKTRVNPHTSSTGTLGANIKHTSQ